VLGTQTRLGMLQLRGQKVGGSLAETAQSSHSVGM